MGIRKNVMKLSNTIQNVSTEVPVSNEYGLKLNLHLEMGFSSTLEHSSFFSFQVSHEDVAL